MKLKREFKELSKLMMDIPTLESSSEGKLRGGFYAVATSPAGMFASQNSCENGCQNSCKNSCVGSCQYSCKDSCQTACQDRCSIDDTTTSPTNPTNTGKISGIGMPMFGFSFVF